MQHMAALSILGYNLTQGFNMKAANENINSNNNNNQDNTISLTKNFNKITVQNVLSESNAINTINISSSNAHAIVKKMKDFGMIGTVNAVKNEISKEKINQGSNSAPTAPTAANRKRSLTESKNSNVKAQTPPNVKKPKISNNKMATPKVASATKKSCENFNQNKLIANAISSGTPGRKGLPAPQAVARRNARERNRVKQVNNGFAALRERIPEEVAEVFEAQSSHCRNGGGASKKLSKVETLRMAVEYIRSLERLLGFDFPIGKDRLLNANASVAETGDDSYSLIKDEFGSLSPTGFDDHDNYDDSLSNYDLDEDFPPHATEDTSLQSTLGYNEPTIPLDMLPNITTLNGFQYIRIPGTNTYQLLTADLFTGNSNSPPTSNLDEDNFNALIDTNCLSPSSSLVTTTADLHSSPTTTTTTGAATTTATTPSSIMQTKTSITKTATAPALQLNSGKNNADHVKVIAIADAATSSSLSQSPVPQQHQHQQQQNSSPPLQAAAAAFPPVANELLLQTCAADRNDPQRRYVAPTHPNLLPSRMIKQEFNETTDIVVTGGSSGGGVEDTSAPVHSPTTAIANGAIIYQQIMSVDSQQHHQQQQQQRHLLGQTSMSMSPPMEHVGGGSDVNGDMHHFNAGVVSVASAALPGYFDHDHNESFYEGVVTFKKELSDVILDTSNNTTGLSDESMIEAIDWWEAHTPKSDGGSVMM